MGLKIIKKDMWQKLTNNTQQIELIKRKISLISSELKEYIIKNRNTDEIGLISGTSGIALFFAYENILNDSDDNNSIIEIILENIFTKLNGGHKDTTLSSGVAGVLWSHKHLKDINIIDDQIDVNEIINWLSISLEHSCKTAFFDYLHGATGVANAIYSYKDTLNPNFYDNMLQQMNYFGIKKSNTIAWESYLHLNNKSYLVINLGLAHGISSIIVFLCQLYQEKFKNELILNLINNSINYLHSVKYSVEENTTSCFYPSYIYNMEKVGGRLAWCYGDLCIASAFYHAGITLENLALIDECKSILINSTKRVELNEVKIKDPAFCHGAIGLSHIYNRFYQRFKINELKDTSLYWQDVALEMSKNSNNVSGFKKFSYGDGFSESNGLLEGKAGIGLCLISSISNIEPKWDKLFCI